MPQPRVIRSLLNSALQLWLRSLVTQVEVLQVEIGASDRQLLRGYIPSVHLQAKGAVYRDLHLSQLLLQADTIRVNLGQVLRGKPLRLVKPITARAQAEVSARDLNRSLDSELLSAALQQLAQRLLPQTPDLEVQRIDLGPNRFSLWGQSRAHSPLKHSVGLTTQIIVRGSKLHCAAPQLLAHGAYANHQLPQSLPDQSFPLSDVTLQQLTLTPNAVALDAQLTILP